MLLHDNYYKVLLTQTHKRSTNDTTCVETKETTTTGKIRLMVFVTSSVRVIDQGINSRPLVGWLHPKVTHRLRRGVWFLN